MQSMLERGFATEYWSRRGFDITIGQEFMLWTLSCTTHALLISGDKHHRVGSSASQRGLRASADLGKQKLVGMEERGYGACGTHCYINITMGDRSPAPSCL